MNSITGVPTMEKYYEYISFNPIFIIILIAIIVLYLVFFGSLGGEISSFSSSSSIDNNLFNSDEKNSGSLKILGIIIASIFMVLILINGFTYFLNINIVADIKKIFSKTPEIDITTDTNLMSNNNNGSIVPEIKYTKQVYHVPNNKYTYDDAKAICNAYGNRLATYKEIESAYNNGADWCSYGWSDNQMALYPTQYKKWNELQNKKGHEHDCGRPGINGGYIDNENVKFGVNCYGYKPKITPLETELMENARLYPLTQKEVDFENKVSMWKNKINDILIAPFNAKKWSRI